MDNVFIFAISGVAFLFAVIVAYLTSFVFGFLSEQRGGLFSFLWSSICYIFAIVSAFAILQGSMQQSKLDTLHEYLANIPVYTLILIWTVFYLKRLGVIFSGFGYYMRPFLIPFIFIFSIPYKIFKYFREKKKADDVLKKFDNF